VAVVGVFGIQDAQAQPGRYQKDPVTSASAGPADPALIEDLVMANRMIVDKDVIKIRGHLSVRHNLDPNRFLMSRSMAPGLVTAADIMEFDLDGNAIDHQGREIFSERYIHSEIYRARPDVMSVIHTHAPALVLFASSPIRLRPLFGAASFMGNDGVPVFQNGVSGGGVGNPPLGEKLAQTIGQGAVVFMRGHGTVVVGFSLQNVVGRLVHLDTNAKLVAQHLSMGQEPIYIVAREDAASRDNDYAREWDSWKRATVRLMEGHDR
jgi:HCOMODA/2-hydroxy-3-carboxy-muconic semialdehyde decarboxylase